MSFSTCFPCFAQCPISPSFFFIFEREKKVTWIGLLFSPYNSPFAQSEKDIIGALFCLFNLCLHFFSEKLHVEYSHHSIQSLDRGGMGWALQSDLRIRIRFLEDGHLPIPGCWVSYLIFTLFWNYNNFRACLDWTERRSSLHEVIRKKCQLIYDSKKPPDPTFQNFGASRSIRQFLWSDVDARFCGSEMVKSTVGKQSRGEGHGGGKFVK